MNDMHDISARAWAAHLEVWQLRRLLLDNAALLNEARDEIIRLEEENKDLNREIDR